MAEPAPIAESLATLRALGDWVEVIDAAAAALWARTEEDEIDPVPWAEADNDSATQCRTVVRKVIEAAAPILERQIRKQIAEEAIQWAASENRNQSSWLWFELGEQRLTKVAEHLADIARGDIAAETETSTRDAT